MTKRLRINPEPKGGSIYLSRGGSILFSGIVTLTFQPKLKNIAGTQIADLCAYPCARYILAPQKPNTPYEVIRHKIYNSEVVTGSARVSMKTKTGAPRAFSGGACRSSILDPPIEFTQSTELSSPPAAISEASRSPLVWATWRKIWPPLYQLGRRTVGTEPARDDTSPVPHFADFICSVSKNAIPNILSPKGRYPL